MSVTSSSSQRPLGNDESAKVWPALMLMRSRSAGVVPFGARSPTMSVRPPCGVAPHGAPSTALSRPGSSGYRMYAPKLSTSYCGRERLYLSLSLSGITTSLTSGQPRRETWIHPPRLRSGPSRWSRRVRWRLAVAWMPRTFCLSAVRAPGRLPPLASLVIGTSSTSDITLTPSVVGAPPTPSRSNTCRSTKNGSSRGPAKKRAPSALAMACSATPSYEPFGNVRSPTCHGATGTLAASTSCWPLSLSIRLTS